MVFWFVIHSRKSLTLYVGVQIINKKSIILCSELHFTFQSWNSVYFTRHVIYTIHQALLCNSNLTENITFFGLEIIFDFTIPVKGTRIQNIAQNERQMLYKF